MKADRLVLVTACLITLILIPLFVWTSQRVAELERSLRGEGVVTVKSLHIVNADGEFRASFGTSEKGSPGLHLFDKDRNRRLTLGVAADGSPKLILHDQTGKSRVQASLANDRPEIYFFTPEEKGQIAIRVTQEGMPRISLFDSKSVERAALGIVKEATSGTVREGPYLALFDDRGNTRTSMYNTLGSGNVSFAGFRLHSPDGRRVAELGTFGDNAYFSLTEKDAGWLSGGLRLSPTSCTIASRTGDHRAVNLFANEAGSGLALAGKDPTARVNLHVSEAGGLSIRTRDKGGIGLSVLDDGRSGLFLQPPEGKGSVTLQTGPEDSSGLAFEDKNGTRRAELTIGEQRVGLLLSDQDGNNRVDLFTTGDGSQQGLSFRHRDGKDDPASIAVQEGE